MAQQKKLIYKAELQYADEEKYPGATVLVGAVKMTHAGAILTCKKAFYYKKTNFFKAIGDVIINQGDTIKQYSDYADYDANLKKAVSWGDVILKDPSMTLTTDTLYFNRGSQLLFYKDHAVIKDETNVLKSKNGNYYLENKKFTHQQVADKMDIARSVVTKMYTAYQQDKQVKISYDYEQTL